MCLFHQQLSTKRKKNKTVKHKRKKWWDKFDDSGVRKTWHMGITERAHPFYILAWCISFVSSNGGYVNPLQHNVGATYVFVTMKFDCMWRTWGSPHIVITNITHPHCFCTIIWVVLLINNYRVCSFHNYNILKSDLSCVSLSTLI